MKRVCKRIYKKWKNADDDDDWSFGRRIYMYIHKYVGMSLDICMYVGLSNGLGLPT